MNTILEMPYFFIGTMTVTIWKQNQNISSHSEKSSCFKCKRSWLAVWTAQPRIFKGSDYYVHYVQFWARQHNLTQCQHLIRCHLHPPIPALSLLLQLFHQYLPAHIFCWRHWTLRGRYASYLLFSSCVMWVHAHWALTKEMQLQACLIQHISERFFLISRHINILL